MNRDDHTGIIRPRNGAAIGTAAYVVEADLDRNGKITQTDYDICIADDGKSSSGGVGEAGLFSKGFCNSIGYYGYVFNEDSGLYTVRFRTYSPALGRWLERDPAGYVDVMDLYEYVRGGAIDATDPLGEEQFHHVITRNSVFDQLFHLLGKDDESRLAKAKEMCRHGDNKWTVRAPGHAGYDKTHREYSQAVREVVREFLNGRKGSGPLSARELDRLYNRILGNPDPRIRGALKEWGVDTKRLRRVPVRVLSDGAGRLGRGGGAAGAGAMLYAANAALVLYIGSESYAEFAEVCEPAKNCQECLAEEVHEGGSIHPSSIIAINGVRAYLRVIPKDGGEVVCVSTPDGRIVTARRDAVGGEIDLDCLDWKKCQ